MPMRCFTALLATAGLLALTAAPVLAQQRVALVIGNAGYAHAPQLANPLNDAADMGEALARLGFQVTKLENADYGALRQGLLAFTRAASTAEVAVVFYAGHGIEVDQRNFLVPVDARLVSDQDVEYEAVPLELVTRSVSRASGLRLVILDACRENPFAVSMQRAGAAWRDWSPQGKRWWRMRRRKARWPRTEAAATVRTARHCWSTSRSLAWR